MTWLGEGRNLKPACERCRPVGHVLVARAHWSVAGIVAGSAVGHCEAPGSVLGLKGTVGLESIEIAVACRLSVAHRGNAVCELGCCSKCVSDRSPATLS
jgi:hypothetical protein